MVANSAAVFGQAFGAGVSDPVQDLRYCEGSRIWRNPDGRVLPSNLESAIAGVRIGTILHPTVLFAFPDCTSFQQHRLSPTIDRAIGGASLPEHQHRELHERGRNRHPTPWFRRITQSWDSQMYRLDLLHLFQ